MVGFELPANWRYERLLDSHGRLTSVSYTHLDVYKRQALIFSYLRPEQTIYGLIREDDDDDVILNKLHYYVNQNFCFFMYNTP